MPLWAWLSVIEFIDSNKAEEYLEPKNTNSGKINIFDDGKLLFIMEALFQKRNLQLLIKSFAMIHHTLEPYLEEIATLLKAHKIRKAYLFGSATTANFTKHSDLDVLVNIEENLDPVEAGEHLWELTYQMEDLLQRKVDLITERSLKNPFFIAEVNKTKVPIYE